METVVACNARHSAPEAGRVEVASRLLQGPLAQLSRLLVRTHGQWGGGAYIDSNSGSWEQCRLCLAAITGAVTGIAKGQSPGLDPAVAHQIAAFREHLAAAWEQAAEISNREDYCGYPDVGARKRYRQLETDRLYSSLEVSGQLDEVVLKLIDFGVSKAPA